VNQITSAGRELFRRRNQVTSPRRQHWTRRRELLARSDATGARINRSHMRGTQPSR
jgi:transposase